MVLIGLFSCKQSLTKKIENTEFGTWIYYVDRTGKIQGQLIELHEAGDTLSISTYQDSMLQGKKCYFRLDGTLESEEYYDKDILNGPILTYHENSVVSTKGNYENGELIGSYFSYYASGQLKEQLEMKENEANGPFKEFYENGNLHWEGTYKNGQEMGILMEYDKLGKLEKKLNCDIHKDMYICQTIWTSKNGAIPQKLAYE